MLHDFFISNHGGFMKNLRILPQLKKVLETIAFLFVMHLLNHLKIFFLLLLLLFKLFTLLIYLSVR